jgi:hypothetical protein
VFFEIFSILLDLLSFQKSSAALIRVEKKLAMQGIKRSVILRCFQKCGEVSSLAKGKTNFTEKLNF